MAVIDLKNSVVQTTADGNTVVLGAADANAASPQLYSAAAIVAAPLTINDATNTLGLQPYAQSNALVTYTAVAPNQAIRFARQDKIDYASSGNNSGAGHSGAHLSYAIRSGAGDPYLLLAGEDKLENNNASGSSALTITCSGATFIVWTNGSTMTAGLTLRFRWDASAGILHMMSAY